jgi:hypothetical protein
MTRWFRLQPILATFSTPLWLIETENDKPLLIGNGERKMVAAVNADYCFLFHFELQNIM